jgi:hypothetical protein
MIVTVALGGGVRGVTGPLWRTGTDEVSKGVLGALNDGRDGIAKAAGPLRASILLICFPNY